jgi:hypothetical protein
MKIYGTITLQEVIVLCLTAMLFVAQPFHGAARVAFIALAVAGVWVLYKDRRLAKSIGIKQLDCIADRLTWNFLLMEFCKRSRDRQIYSFCANIFLCWRDNLLAVHE